MKEKIDITFAKGIDDHKMLIEEKCEYCKEDGFNPLNNTADYSGLEIAISNKGMLRVRNYNFKEVFESQDAVNISYCPMCGRKLGK